MKFKKFAIGFAVFVIAVGILYYSRLRRPEIDDVWYINLDRDTERNEHYKTIAHLFGVSVTRFPGTYGRSVNRKEARDKYGICTSLTRSNDEEENKRNPNIIHHPGVKGCWISHKRLLMHLNTLALPSNYGHLITEDDIIVPPDFRAQWSMIRQNIPYNWDIVYLYTGATNGEPIAPNILRWKNDKPTGNWGGVAYIVRHGALPSILYELRFMDGPIDEQFYRHLGHLNIYIVHPSLITTGELESSIAAVNRGE